MIKTPKTDKLEKRKFESPAARSKALAAYSRKLEREVERLKHVMRNDNEAQDLMLADLDRARRDANYWQETAARYFKRMGEIHSTLVTTGEKLERVTAEYEISLQVKPSIAGLLAHYAGCALVLSERIKERCTTAARAARAEVVLGLSKAIPVTARLFT